MDERQGRSGRGVRNIAELAKLAGVSAGTVSRALAGKSVVNAQTRTRIEALAAEHNFRPNQMARRLRTQRTGVIGVVVPLGHERRQHISDPFFMTMLGHLADALTENGYDVMLSRTIPDAEDWLESIVDSGMLDGVFVIGQSTQFEAIERVASQYRPLVVWGSHWEGQVHCAVGTDNVRGGYLAGEHLIERGKRRLAFLGDVQTPEIRQRYEGVLAASAAAGLPAPLQLATHLASDVMESEIAAHVARVGQEIDGLACASDVIAMNALRVLADHGLSVPDQIGVVGFDDLPLAGQTMPRLTTVRQDISAGAKAMIAALYARLAGDDAPSVEMAPVLVERDST